MQNQEISKEGKSRVFIVDDHPIVRHGIAQLLSDEPDITVCGEAADAGKALAVIHKMKPDLAIIDLSLCGIDGMEIIKGMRDKHAQLPILVLSMHDESVFAERVLRAGAKGYIMKQEATEKLVNAVRKVLNGDIYVSEKMISRMINQFIDGKPNKNDSSIKALSDREMQIFQLLGQGHDMRQIAEELFLSIKTVESHSAHIKEKLKLKTSSELLHYATKWTEGGRAF